MRKEKPSFVCESWKIFHFHFCPTRTCSGTHRQLALLTYLFFLMCILFCFNKVIDDLIFSLIVSPIQESIALSPHTAENREEIFCIFYAIYSSSTRRRELSWRSNVDDTLPSFWSKAPKWMSNSLLTSSWLLLGQIDFYTAALLRSSDKR